VHGAQNALWRTARAGVDPRDHEIITAVYSQSTTLTAASPPPPVPRARQSNHRLTQNRVDV